MDFLSGFVLVLVGLELLSSFDLATFFAIAVGTEPTVVFRFFVTFESVGSSLSPEGPMCLPFTCDKIAGGDCIKEFATTFTGDTCTEESRDRAPIPGLDTGSSSSLSPSLSSSFLFSSSSSDGAKTRLLSSTRSADRYGSSLTIRTLLIFLTIITFDLISMGFIDRLYDLRALGRGAFRGDPPRV